MHFWLSIAVFVMVYALIITEKIHRTIVALLGAAIITAIGVISQEKAFAAIDFNTIGLLIGMMIIVGITRQSGVFEYLAIKSAKLVGGKPLAIMGVLALITALASALLDNVTTVLLIVPVTFAITDRLDISPIPFLFTEIIASNIGGTATLIGDPPNLMIGSATGLGFMDFVANLALPVLVILLVTIALMLFIFRKQLHTSDERIQSIFELNEKEAIKDWLLLKRSLLILALTIIGFLLHQSLHLESATVALLGAAVLMLISNEHPEETLLNIEWPTIFFFAGLFILVGGLVETGVIELIAHKALLITEGSLVRTGMLVLWLSALASACVDNIPFVATMIPLLQTIGQLSSLPMESIWWALAMGACLGGNGTLIGASANVIVAGIAERYGTPLGFIDFLKVGFPLMILSIILSMLYLYLFFWR
ncbi:MAG: ArsB/NhaD family transporter [Syntrophomonadaceae bacterium]|nr:ArsB/NhaD family transporter [Syntrophomonadaceae bacterium]